LRVATVQDDERDSVMKVSTSVVSPPLQALVRKLFNVRKRGNGSSASQASGDVVFEFSSDELSRWMTEAVAQITAEARAALLNMGTAMIQERKAVHGFCSELQATVLGLGADVKSFMRRQAIRIETQVGA
jgi:hypothetical protein